MDGEALSLLADPDTFFSHGVQDPIFDAFDDGGLVTAASEFREFT